MIDPKTLLRLITATIEVKGCKLNEVFEELTDREKKVLKMRFGLETGDTHTLKEVGKELSVTQERIRQIEAKALEKLRTY